MITHVVVMKFNPDTPDEAIKELETMLAELPNKIMEIHSYEFGRDIVGSERSYDFGLVSLFANTDTLARYQKHPEHLKVIEKLKAICAKIVTVDYDMEMEKEMDPDKMALWR